MPWVINGFCGVVNTTACCAICHVRDTCTRCSFDNGEHCVGGAAKVSHFLTSSSVLECSCMLVRIPFICVPTVDTSQVFQVCTKIFRAARLFPSIVLLVRNLLLVLLVFVSRGSVCRRENGFVIVQMCALYSCVRVVADVRNRFLNVRTNMHQDGRCFH